MRLQPGGTAGTSTVRTTLSCWIHLHLPHPSRDLSLVFSPGSSAAEKFTGDPSLGGDLDDEDLLTGDLECVELLDSSKSLHLRTGVLDLLAGACDSPVLDVDGDLSTTCLSTVGLSWFSGNGITVSMRLCINNIIDIKSNGLA